MRPETMHDDKTRRSCLVEEAAAGEAFVIGMAGRPMVRRLGLLGSSAPCPTTSIKWLPARLPICLKALGKAAEPRHAEAAVLITSEPPLASYPVPLLFMAATESCSGAWSCRPPPAHPAQPGSPPRCSDRQPCCRLWYDLPAAVNGFPY